ncbi:conserved hypothetical protein [Leishmania mexicana MHOM/GT/2001/U1103]|uniref:Uncharacterized protein n=1 Tax=Leishmania mexicana (strain MHOM/GT/2001/U1103) TaxID=929439 RepID=E9AJF9_LEIMU|nr:conserved hypothetical protein [Leishmania mexicana MHOM/GT/2001/U1103]CBZ23056.1 conserved hypothetical protein [Leishmania mexicana MHOM/GT/2001/U1103]
MSMMTMTSSSSPHAGHAPWRTAAFEVRGLRSSRHSPQPRSRRCYTTTATAASTPASAAAAGGSASTRPQTTRRRHVMDLGSKLSVGLPGPGPSPTPSSPRHHRGSRRHHGRTTSKGNAADGAVHVQSREALKQPPPSLRHPRQATPTSLLPRQQHATPVEREGDEAGLLRIPRTAAEAVALLECATVLEALEPSSSAHLPPCSAAPASKSAGAAPSDVRANFEELGTRALPLLFHFAQVAATSSAPLAGDAAASVTDAKLAAALQCLAAHLQYMAAATRTDGLRHVSALPPAVVVALWEQVMPSVHQRFCKAKAPPPLPPRQGNLAELVEVEEGGDGTGATTELRNAADALASSTRVAATRPAPTASMKKSVYVPLRRALALHTRQIASLLPPPALALVLTRMYQCGALADDVLGPIAADYLEVLRRSGPGQTTSGGDLIAVLRQRVLRLPNGVGSGDGDGLDAAPPAAAFTGAAAVTMARLLGRAAIPGHHQLHRIFHLALLPEVTRVLGRAAERATQGVADEATGEAVEALPGATVLLDLTAALRHYAVSGHAVTHLTTLWTAYFAHRPRTDDAAAALADCTALLRALSSVPSASSRTQRRQARNICADGSHGGLNATQQRNQLLKVTDGDYYPLVDVVCAQVCRLCNHLLSPAATNDVATVAPTQLLALLCLLLRVSSPHWAETYEMLASAVLAALAYTAASLAALAPSRPEDDELERLLPLAAARRTLHALLHRNSLIPDHPLHRVLLRRVLHSPAAMTDTAVASQVLLGLELMVPEEEGSARTNGASAATAMPAAAEGISRSNKAVAATTATSASAGPTVALVATATGTAAQTLMSTVAITPDDRHRALQVFRRLGRSVTPTAFVAGLCVVALDTLPRTAQVAVVNHLTSVASAVSPSYLVKGMDAVVRQLPTSAIDDVSVQHWFSRFTARDVVRRVDPVGCAVLLDMLSANPRYQRNCALAKECITRRIGVALRQTGEDGVGNDAASAVSLDALPRVVAALQRANVFLPQYYSRVCRLLLGQVEQAPLGEVLQPFAVVAEAYMSRQRSEAQASVFKDVWELLRGRVMEEAGRLTLHETLMAINGFAALDVTDHALFGVLVYQLWVCLCTAEAQVAGVPAMRPAHSVQQPRENGEAAEAAAATTDDKDEAAEAKVYRRVQAAQHVLRTLTPSAVAVVTVTLLARSDVRASYAAQARAAAAVGVVRKDEDEDDNAVRTLLPWMLLGLRDCREELYPVDVVHLMPSLLEHYAAAATVEDASAPATAYTDRYAALLHNAYDACRSTFLLMYALLPDAVAAAEEPLLPLAEQQRIAEQRSQWTPATKLSVEVVPRPWFATLLVSLSSAALVDVAVALACVRRACTRRVCSDLLPISQLIDVCLSLCWLTTSTGLRTTTKSPSATAHRSADDAQAPATPPVTRQDELSSPLPAPGDVLRTAMATVLSALWKRSDELTSAQIGALLRCLRDTYGADTVDADFVERLEAQKALLLSQRQQKRPAAAAAGPVSATEAANGGSDGASTAAPPQQQRPKPLPRMDPEDLFRTT